MKALAEWKGKLAFEAKSGSGFSVPLDTSRESGGDENGIRPMEMLLLGLAGCTGMDVISILQKKKQNVTGFEVRVNGERANDHPKVFTDIEVEYVVRGTNIDPQAVERAVELSETKYCSANAMLRKTANITHKITIE